MGFVSEYRAAAGPNEKRAAAERALLRLILTDPDCPGLFQMDAPTEAAIMHSVRLGNDASTVEWLDAVIDIVIQSIQQ